MKNEIILNDIKSKKNIVEYNYSVKGPWEQYFENKKYYIEYDESIELVPKSILSIPFVGNILPLAWVFDATINVKELDKSFFNCIEDVKIGYKNMYPKIKFKGNLQVDNLIDNNYETTNQSLAFFSGGADAYSTLITHIKEKPILITLWGADIKISDEKRWKLIEKGIKREAHENNLQNIIVKTSFREIFNYKKINNYIKPKANDRWWHGFQHGVAIITHAAPICYIYKANKIYIAASFTKDYHEVCASHPTIDNYIKMASASIIHDGYEYTRSDKIRRICEYAKENNKNINVRVCLAENTVKNCCNCEKCYRTIMAAISEGQDPKQLGFEYDEAKLFKQIEKDMKYKIILGHTKNWKVIQDKFTENYDTLKNDRRINWIFDYDFDKNNINIYKKIWRCRNGIIRRLNKLRRQNKNGE